MSYENPTPLQIGASGVLNGWQVRVAGRVVMGVDVEGVTYYWNEFNLLDDTGNSATLVFEETEDGYEWKLFREFTPLRSLAVREAAAKKVGDMVNLDGTAVRITLVDQSRVYHIEGDAPEGIEVGDVANYFNADTGTRMLVGSWTGDEIQFYEGLDMPAEGVADAFGFSRDAIRPPAASGFAGDSSSHVTGGTAGSGRSSLVFKIVLVVFGIAVALGAYSCFSGRSSRATTSAPPSKQPAPTLHLANGARGSLAQHTFVITGQAVTEVSRPGSRHERREYLLRDEAGATALLINGLSGGAKEWHLLRTTPPPSGLTPFEAATKRRGSPLAVDGRSAAITDLFQVKTISLEGTEAAGIAPVGVTEYGFVARDGADVLVARWTETQLEFFRGQVTPEADVLAALNRPPQKTK